MNFQNNHLHCPALRGHKSFPYLFFSNNINTNRFLWGKNSFAIFIRVIFVSFLVLCDRNDYYFWFNILKERNFFFFFEFLKYNQRFCLRTMDKETQTLKVHSKAEYAVRQRITYNDSLSPLRHSAIFASKIQ